MKIEKGIPLPARRTGLAETMRALEVGDSFLANNCGKSTPYSLAQRYGIKIAIREEGGKARIWRVA